MTRVPYRATRARRCATLRRGPFRFPIITCSLRQGQMSIPLTVAVNLEALRRPHFMSAHCQVPGQTPMGTGSLPLKKRKSAPKSGCPLSFSRHIHGRPSLKATALEEIPPVAFEASAAIQQSEASAPLVNSQNLLETIRQGADARHFVKVASGKAELSHRS